MVTEEEAIECLLLFYEKGDKNALGKFSTFYFNYIYRTAVYYVNNQDDAEDICQQVFVSLLSSHNRCEGAYERVPIKVRTWLGIVCANISKNFLRSKKNQVKKIEASKEAGRFQEFTEDNYEEDFVADFAMRSKEILKLKRASRTEAVTEPDSNWVFRSDEKNSQFLSELLDVLPAKYRVPLLLRYKEELSFAEIADVMNCKQVTIRSHISRGLKYLREQFADHKMSISAVGLLKLLSTMDIKGAPPHLLEKCLSSQVATKSAKLALMKPAVTSAFNYPLFFLMLSTLGAALYLGYLNFMPQKKEIVPAMPAPVVTDEVPKPETDKPAVVKEPEIVNGKKTWDFTKDDTGSDIKRLSGEWGIEKESSGFGPTKAGTYMVQFPYKYLRPTKVVVKGFVRNVESNDFVACAFAPSDAGVIEDCKLIYEKNMYFNPKQVSDVTIVYYVTNGYVITTYPINNGLNIFEIFTTIKDKFFYFNSSRFYVKQVTFSDFTKADVNFIKGITVREKLSKDIKAKIEKSLTNE